MNLVPRISVAAKVVGQKKLVFTDWRIPLPPNADDSGRFTLRDLIIAIVRREVESFKERQEQRKLAQIFTAAQIQEGATRGKIDMGDKDFEQVVNEDEAVSTALQAFEDGLYFVFIDDVQHESLNQTVFIGEDSHVLFVRLIALVGG
jgi:hypothetical protein